MKPKPTNLLEVVWTLNEAQQLLSNWEEKLKNKFHVALAGSVLYNGASTNDMDVIIYPHKRLEDRVFSEQVSQLLGLRLVPIPNRNRNYPPNRLICELHLDGKKINVFLVNF